MVCYGCFAFFLLLGGLLGAMAGYYPLDTDHKEIVCGLHAELFIHSKAVDLVRAQLHSSTSPRGRPRGCVPPCLGYLPP